MSGLGAWGLAYDVIVGLLYISINPAKDNFTRQDGLVVEKWNPCYLSSSLLQELQESADLVSQNDVIDMV